MTGSTWTWVGGTASGTIASNWTLAGTGTNGVPADGDTAVITAGTVQLGLDSQLVGNTIDLGGTSGNAALSISGDAAISFANPSFDQNTLLTTAVPNQSGAVSATLSTGGVFVNDGTILADGPAGSSLTISVQPTLVGTTTVAGNFSDDGQMQVAAGNTLSLAVASGSAASVGGAAGSAGTITVNGLLRDSGGLTVGGAGQGLLSVLNGGTVNVASGELDLGSSAGGSGTMVVSATSGTALVTLGTATTGLNVGLGGQGTLQVLSGGSLSVLSSGGGITLGASTGSAGTLQVSGATAVVSLGSQANTLRVGEAGAGELDIISGGKVALQSSFGVIAADQVGSSATIKVSGAGSSLTAGFPDVGMSLAYSGSALLDIESGGAVTVNDLFVALNSDGNATILVAGTGSSLTAETQMTLAQSGSATLTVQAGGSVFNNVKLDVAAGVGASGSITVTGAGSRLIEYGQFILGDLGTGVLNVQSGGSVAASELDVGGPYSPGPQGGVGTLAVTTGGHVQATNLFVWSGSTISVTGNGSGIDVGSSNAYISDAVNIESGSTLSGSGLVAAEVQNNGVALAQSAGVVGTSRLELQGSVTGTGTLSLGNNAILQLDAGVASTQAVSFGTGSELILNAPGVSFANAITGLAVGDRIELNLGTNVAITAAVVTTPGTISVTTTTGSYQLTNVSFASGSGQSLTWGQDVTTGNSYIQVLAASTYTWTGGTDTAWSTPGNWSGGVVPGATDQTDFVGAPGTVTGTGNAIEAVIGTPGTASGGHWTFNNATITLAGEPGAGALPSAVGFYAKTVLNGGTLNAAGGTASIGGPGLVTVTAEGAAQVTTAGDNVGTEAGQGGALVVTGANTTWIEQPGTAINGTAPGFLIVGGAAGSSGAVSVSNGATLNTGSLAQLGVNTGSTGGAAISTGGVWTASSGAVIGQGGTGTVNVDAATLATGAATTLGKAAGSSGTVQVADGGTLTNIGGLTVGGAGTGNLQVSGTSSTASSTDSLVLGQGTNGTGSATVSSAGYLSAGALVVGDAGLGTLSIQSHGSVAINSSGSADAVAAIIGQQAGSDGSSISVIGSASALGVTGTLDVGDAASGSLNVAGGGTVTASAIQTGVQAGGTGVITVSGTASNLTTTGSLTVGGDGTGELMVLSGASGSIGGVLNVGQTANGSGNVDIEGSTLTVGGNVNIGGSAVGVLTIGLTGELTTTGGINVGALGTFNKYGLVDPAFLSNANTTNIYSTSTDTYDAYVYNVGQITVQTGVTYTLDTPQITDDGVSGGFINIGSASAGLILNADTVSGQTIAFKDATGSLTIGYDVLANIETPNSGQGPFTTVANPNYGKMLIGGFNGVISGFRAGDHITVDTTQAATFSQNGSVVSVIANGTTLGVLTFANTTQATTAMTPGTLIDNQVTPPPCFAAGTRIRTAQGEIAVEDLRAGDLVWSVLGQGFEPVQWIGHRQVDCQAHPQPRAVWPVLISAGAFGPTLPAHDLLVSPDHALFLNDVLIPAKQLVNGGSIRQVPVASVTYYHVELPQHDVLLAEGLAAESYLDVDDRSSFANGGPVVALHPDFARHRWEGRWESEACAPLQLVGPEVEAARALLARQVGRAAA